VSFYTDGVKPQDLIDTPQNVAMVVFIPKDKCDKAMERLKAND
jgi:hypothetical protein